MHYALPTDLAPYSISPILMFTAQSHAEFMASTGNVSHTGFGGSSLKDRLLAAGYPLAGDLSLGGFASENITSGNEDRSAQSAVDGWTGDALHLNTMISPNLSEIGAGVAIANGRVYYVIDAAQPTTGGVPQVSTAIAGSGSTVPSTEPAKRASQLQLSARQIPKVTSSMRCRLGNPYGRSQLPMMLRSRILSGSIICLIITFIPAASW